MRFVRERHESAGQEQSRRLSMTAGHTKPQSRSGAFRGHLHSIHDVPLAYDDALPISIGTAWGLRRMPAFGCCMEWMTDSRHLGSAAPTSFNPKRQSLLLCLGWSMTTRSRLSCEFYLYRGVGLGGGQRPKKKVCVPKIDLADNFGLL